MIKEHTLYNINSSQSVEVCFVMHDTVYLEYVSFPHEKNAHSFVVGVSYKCLADSGYTIHVQSLVLHKQGTPIH